MDGPDVPPLSIASRESRRSPPSCDAAWQEKHCVAKMGRILFSKKSAEAGESAASRGRADRSIPAKNRGRILRLLISLLSQRWNFYSRMCTIVALIARQLRHGREPAREEN